MVMTSGGASETCGMVGAGSSGVRMSVSSPLEVGSVPVYKRAHRH